MKNKIKQCPLCHESILVKNRKSHLLSFHLEDNLDLVLAVFNKYSINYFTAEEKALLEEKFEYANISDSIEKFRIQIKLREFEPKIAQIRQAQYVEVILDEFNSISLSLIKLKQQAKDLRQLGMINKMLAKIENMLLEKPTKENYYLNTDICILCNERIQKSVLCEHLLKVHKDKSSTELESTILHYHSKLTESDNRILNQKRFAEQQREIKKQSQKIAEQKREDDRLEKIEKNLEHVVNIRYYTLEKEIDRLHDTDYIEMVDSKIIKIKQNLKKLLDSVMYGKVEERKNNLLLQRLHEFENTIPTKENFIKDNCQKIYITWDDVYFERNKIYITANKGIVHPIPIKGSLSILNEIKVEYFRRIFKSEVFKLVVRNGQIRQDLSKDLSKIEGLITERIKEIQTVKNWQTVKHAPIFNGSGSKEEIIDFINSQSLKNSFLKYPATLLNKNDNVRALLEINNSIEEEALLFIFRRDKYGFLLWENINSNRAAYIFCFDIKKLNISISEIVQLIITNSEYKRENLFRGVDIKKTYNISCISYKSIIHDYHSDYKNNLDRIFRS